MLDRIITHADFLDAVDELARDRRIIGPVSHGDHWLYQPVRRADELDLAFAYSVYAPRAALFPPVETLLTFERENGRFIAHPVFDRTPQALVGVHPCDLHAIRLLDRVFSMLHHDEHYLARRASTFIVGIDCPEPCCLGVFCADMGTHYAADGFDVMLHRLPHDPHDEPRYGVVFGTREGREWLLAGDRCTLPTRDDVAAMADYQRQKEASFSPRLRVRGEDLPALLERSYHSLLWDATARRCYSCGSCNLACPTCYCFNVIDDLDLSQTSGRRRREWDGCQLPDFAVVAGGHNFRPTAAARLRHRIYRKAKWIRERTGLTACVGCARCERACTAKISPAELYNQLAEDVP